MMFEEFKRCIKNFSAFVYAVKSFFTIQFENFLNKFSVQKRVKIQFRNAKFFAESINHRNSSIEF